MQSHRIAPDPSMWFEVELWGGIEYTTVDGGATNEKPGRASLVAGDSQPPVVAGDAPIGAGLAAVAVGAHRQGESEHRAPLPLGPHSDFAAVVPHHLPRHRQPEVRPLPSLEREGNEQLNEHLSGLCEAVVGDLDDDELLYSARLHSNATSGTDSLERLLQDVLDHAEHPPAVDRKSVV